MSMVYKLVFGLLIFGAASVATGGWGGWVFLAGVVAWNLRRFVGWQSSPKRGSGRGGFTAQLSPTSRKGGKDEAYWHEYNQKPEAPTVDEFRAAGVDATKCMRCRNALKSLGYYFGLDGKPTVYCPACWSKHVRTSTNWQAFRDRMTTRASKRKPV
jgi:hypothetical protein